MSAKVITLKTTENNVTETGYPQTLTKAVFDDNGRSLGSVLGYTYKGIANKNTNPGTPDGNIFYIASTPGTYTYFNSIVVAEGEVAILKFDTAWHKETSGAASTEQVNQLGQQLFESLINKDIRNNKVITESTLTWMANEQLSYSYIINRNEHFGSYLQVIPRNVQSSIAFLVELGATAPVFCEDTPTIIHITEKTKLEIPQDCKYIYVYGSWNGTDIYYPEGLNCLYNSKDIQEIENDVLNVSETVDSIFPLTDLYGVGTVVNACIINTTGNWISEGRCYFIDLSQYNADTLNVVGNSSYETNIAFLKEIPQSYSGHANFCDGESGVYRFGLGESKSFGIPIDCHCIYVFDYYNISQNAYPQSIILLGVSIHKLDNISEELANVDASVESIKRNTTNGQDNTKLVEQANVPDLDLTDYIIDGNICIIGDSTIAGYISNVPIASYLNCTGTKTDISQSGDTISGQLTKWNNLPSATRVAVNYIFVQIGLNDMAPTETNDEISSRYQSLVSALRSDAPNSKIILCTMVPDKQRLIDLYPGTWANGYDHWQVLNYQIKNCLFIGCDTSIDAHTIMLNDGNDNLLSIYDTGDHIHPNAAGGKIIAWSWLCGYRK